jgi:hypothetical protein
MKTPTTQRLIASAIGGVVFFFFLMYVVGDSLAPFLGWRHLTMVGVSAAGCFALVEQIVNFAFQKLGATAAKGAQA